MLPVVCSCSGSPHLSSSEDVLVQQGARDSLLSVPYASSSSQDAPRRLPLGYELCGEVEQVGAAVSALRAGDRVVGLLPLDRAGAAASTVVVDSTLLAPIPRDCALSPTSLAASVRPGVRAFTVLHKMMSVCAGDTLLVTAAGLVRVLACFLFLLLLLCATND